ncbi:MAG: hypothetical protein KA886_05415 [Candidatus Cloacimonetes bacterium]|nr:hypothetical protein [Candidatus Cloacimonadota bacterium]
MISFMDKQSRDALQINYILAKIQTFSEPGARLHKNFKPFRKNQKYELLSYYEKVQTLMTAISKYPDLITTLGSYLHYFQWILKSIEDSSECLLKDDYALEIHEIFEIKHFLYYYQKTVQYLKKRNLITVIPLYDFSDLFDYLDKEKQNTPSFYLSPSYSAELEAVYSKIKQLKQLIENEYSQLKKQLIKEFNLYEFNDKLTVSRLKTDMIQKLNQSPLLAIEYENFANITYVLKKSDVILSAEQDISDLNESLFVEEKKVRMMISQKIGSQSKDLIVSFHSIATLDLMLAKAIFAHNQKGVIPMIADQPFIYAKNLKNLALKDELERIDLQYQPVDIHFKQIVTVLTGANMAGKTSILKGIGQAFVLLVQGIPLPADKATLFIPDFICYSGPLTQEHRADLSSFALEVVELQNMIDKKGYGLILMDEFARGTNPEEGTALSKAVIHFFSENLKSHFITATHFNPPEVSKNTEHFRLLGISEADFKSLRSKDKVWLKNNLNEIHSHFNYQMIPVEIGSQPPKAAFMIAELLGLDNQILDTARCILKNEK